MPRMVKIRELATSHALLLRRQSIMRWQKCKYKCKCRPEGDAEGSRTLMRALADRPHPAWLLGPLEFLGLWANHGRSGEVLVIDHARYCP